MLKVSSPEILEYRKAIEERKIDLPIWERKVITCEEAAAYSGIGIKRLRKALAIFCFDCSAILPFVVFILHLSVYVTITANV